MPRCPTTGKVTRARFTSLKLAELSSVDRPAQVGALATIMKRDDSVPPVLKAMPSLIARAVAKYVDEEDGAHTFQEVLAANEFDERIWPMTSALSQAIRSIMGDTSIKQPDRETKVTQSVDEFLSAVRNLSPTAATDAEKRLLQLISKGSDDMHTIEQLTAKVAELDGQLTSANALVASEKARADKAEGELATTAKALADATEEVIKVDGTDVKKSEVGAASFATFKVLENRARTAELEKRASEEFGNLPGTATEKALVLKHRDGMDEATQKAFDAILTGAQQMAKAGFSRLGHTGDAPQDVAKARQTFTAKVEEVKKRDNLTPSKAMSKAREEFPDEYAAAYPAADAE